MANPPAACGICGEPFANANVHRIGDGVRILECATCHVCRTTEILFVVFGEPLVVRNEPWKPDAVDGRRLFLKRRVTARRFRIEDEAG